MNELTHSSAKIFLTSAGANKVVNSTTINTDISFYFTPLILSNTDASHFILGLEQASIPMSINMVNSNNNVIYLDSVKYTITAGNFTITNLVTEFNDGISFGGVGLLFKMVYNSVTNTIGIIKVAGGTFTIGSGTTAQKILGVAVGTYTSVLLVGAQMPGVVNLCSTTGIILQIDNVTTSNRDNSGAAGATLARIPINCSMNRILQYFNPTPFFSQITNRELTFLRIKLLNDDYTPLALTGNPDWFIVLRVDYSERNLPMIVPSNITHMRQEQIRQQEAALLELQ